MVSSPIFSSSCLSSATRHWPAKRIRQSSTTFDNPSPGSKKIQGSVGYSNSIRFITSVWTRVQYYKLLHLVYCIDIMLRVRNMLLCCCNLPCVLIRVVQSASDGNVSSCPRVGGNPWIGTHQPCSELFLLLFF